jgi:hypothetical protein
MSDKTPNPLSISDEDFVNSMAPAVEEDPVTPEKPEAEVDGSDNGEGEAEAGKEGDGKEAEGNPEGEGDPESDPAGSEEGKEGDEGKPAAGDADGKPADPNASVSGASEEATDAEGKPKKAEPAKSEEGGEDAPTFMVPTTIRANGKDITLKSEAEAVQLMQMGAHYTRKMQELAPHRKLLMMLQNNGLADEAKLTFLIDLDKKNPEAIKKLIQDAGVDPLEIDTSTDADYLPGAYGVSDVEENFRSTLETLASEENGRETITLINNKWDETSKQVVYSNPEIMTTIHEHRTMGVYDTIVTEMDRQITLGKIPAGTPFLEAYKQVGDQLSKEAGYDPAEGNNGAKNGQGGNGQGQRPAAPAPVQVATRAAAPKAKLANDDKASAASPTRNSPVTAKPVVNVLAQSDEEFMKQMEGRL